MCRPQDYSSLERSLAASAVYGDFLLPAICSANNKGSDTCCDCRYCVSLSGLYHKISSRTSNRRSLQNSLRDTTTKRVRFDFVSIRLYPIVLSDNPSCNEGAPIELGWQHFQEHEVSVNDFERRHRSKRSDFKLTALQRNHRLLSLGYSARDIQDAQLGVMHTRHLRAKTIAKLRSPFGRFSDRVQERTESLYKGKSLSSSRILPNGRKQQRRRRESARRHKTVILQ